MLDLSAPTIFQLYKLGTLALALLKEDSTWVLGPGTPSGASYHHHPQRSLGQVFVDGTIVLTRPPQIARREYTSVGVHPPSVGF